MPNGTREVRAEFDGASITVYQAYAPHIAEPAAARQTLRVPGFKTDRMTWVKPSFLWMMYRSGWATKPGQERVLKIAITREGFEWALANGCLSHFDADLHASHEAWKHALATAHVRIQWDPDRDLRLERRERRAIQVGLSGPAVDRYVDEWVTAITDVTDLCRAVKSAVDRGDLPEARALLPEERVYPGG